ncbi:MULTISPECIES: phosphopantetheine-binding protein [Rummeliibacillus]|jgi:bifunctional isochorismate lyase/aryl carrier protein|uniref:phosphopantetheine-binding protein n=1 Tax=Rummeliibacillus TaxID=648802 RepID=UPI0011B38A38|nr:MULTISPECIES: phosphopantetheine-binding protein [Rummeliibacillus]MBO2535333.1 isochorismatase [Rummeliibacillus suwonensis]
MTKQELKTLVQEYLDEDLEEVDWTESLLDLGMDSIRMMAIVDDIRVTGINVNFMEFAEKPSLEGWYNAITLHTN